jgi:uncharacterized membrane protein YcaP (DUF421 family)
MEWPALLHDTWQTSLVFVSLLILTRLLGKTQVSQLTFYEYVSGITIGSIAANIAAAEPDKFWNFFYDMLLFVFLTYLLSVVKEVHRPLRKMIEGSPTIVIENGTILEEAMGKMRYDLDELTGQLREKGVFDITEVQYAILETSGTLSVIKKADYQPVTKEDLHIPCSTVHFPIELVMDGVIIERNLRKQNLSQAWLMQELAKRHIDSIDNVTYACIDSKGKLFINPQTESEQV